MAVTVVGPTAQTAPLRAMVAKSAGSAFEIGSVTTAAQARVPFGSAISTRPSD